MLEDNNVRLALLKKEHVVEKERDQNIIKEMMANEEKLQRQRESEFKARLDKIQAKMSKMADTVVKNQRDKELREERRLLALQTEKERADLTEENNRKNRIMNQNQMIQDYLKKQMDDKQENKVKEKQNDKSLAERMIQKTRNDLDEEERHHQE